MDHNQTIVCNPPKSAIQRRICIFFEISFKILNAPICKGAFERWILCNFEYTCLYNYILELELEYLKIRINKILEYKLNLNGISYLVHRA